MELRGIFPVVYTPFDDSGLVDESDLCKLVDYLLACGVRGLLADGGASECLYLTPEERKRNVTVILDRVQGRVPVIVGVSARDTPTQMELAHHAEQSGAYAVLAAPPPDGAADTDAIHAHYAALANAVRLPIMVHRYTIPIATAQIIELMRECPNIRYLKEETPDAAGHLITELRRHDRSIPIFSGAKYLLDELARGVVGAIPGSVCVADQVCAYDCFVRGDLVGARQAHHHALPLLFARRQAYLAWSKEVLRRQGIFKTARVREPGQTMDEYDLRELTAIMDAMGEPF